MVEVIKAPILDVELIHLLAKSTRTFDVLVKRIKREKLLCIRQTRQRSSENDEQDFVHFVNDIKNAFQYNLQICPSLLQIMKNLFLFLDMQVEILLGIDIHQCTCIPTLHQQTSILLSFII